MGFCGLLPCQSVWVSSLCSTSLEHLLTPHAGGLTTIVLGESLNGLIDPLTVVAKSIGFGMQSAFQIITVALAVFLIFVLYFASFDLKAGATSLRQNLIVFGHFPLFICIVLCE